MAGAANLTVGGAMNLTTSIMNLNCAMFNVNAGFTNFAGPVQTPVIIAQAVAGTVYTPGLGNLL